MSFSLEVLREAPQGLWMLDSASPFPDLSGYGRAASSSAAAPVHVPLVNGAAYSSVFYSTVTGSFTAPVFTQGSESSAFTLEVAGVRPIEKAASAGEQQILGNLNQMDGLIVNGTVISFVTKYLTTGESRASYDIQQLQNVHVVGVHTAARNSLYINGELVAESSISDVQMADKFVATSPALYSGATASTDRLAINGVAVYATALESEVIKRHNVVLSRAMRPEDVAIVYTADRLPLSYDPTDIFLSQTWSSQEEWERGLRTDVAVSDAKLIPQLNLGTSIAGSWYDIFPIDFANVASIFGVNMTWDGVGATIQASLDGVTWETAEQGRNLSLIPIGFNPIDKSLQIRITFPGGIYNDQSFVDNLTITGITTGTNPGAGGRNVTLSGVASTKNRYPVIELHDNWGVELEGGTLTISGTTETSATPINTLSMWVKRTGAAALTTSTSLTGTYWVRGVSVAFDVATPVGEWALVFIKPTTPVPIGSSMSFTGFAEIAEVMLYPTLLTSATMQEIERAFMGRVVIRAGDNSIISIAEPPNAATVYSHDWSVTLAG